jgi:hypothetical protein
MRSLAWQQNKACNHRLTISCPLALRRVRVHQSRIDEESTRYPVAEEPVASFPTRERNFTDRFLCRACTIVTAWGIITIILVHQEALSESKVSDRRSFLESASAACTACEIEFRELDGSQGRLQQIRQS